MITAKEAKELYDKSGQEVDDWVESNVEKVVIGEATRGKRYCTVHLDAIESFMYYTATPLQKAVLDKLQALGYLVSISKSGEQYVPAGLSDDYGEGPMYVNVVMNIGW